MEYVEVTIKEVKEVKAILELVQVIAVDVKAKKAAADVVADVLPKLVAALESASQLPEELKDENLYATVALGVANIVQALKA